MSSTSLWYATRASGLMAMVLLTLTMVLGITTTTRARARHWPGFAQQELHRRLSMIAVVFLGIHVLTSVLDTYVNISWAAVVIPFTSSYGRLWVGVGAICARPDAGRLRVEPAASPHAPGDLASHPLAGLPELARRIGPHLRHGDRRRGDLGHRARCRLRPRRRRGAVLADPSRRAPGLGQEGPRRAGRRRPSKHLASDGAARRRDRHVPSAGDLLAATDHYRLLGHPTDLAGHVAALGPVPLPVRRRPAAGATASSPCWRPPVWPAGAEPVSPPPSSSRWPSAGGPAAPSWSTPWRGSPPATRTSSCSSARRISCSTVRSSWRPPGAGRVDGLRARGGASMWPRQSARAFDERSARRLRARARGDGASTGPLHRRGGVGAGALGRLRPVTPVLPARQGRRPAHRPQRRPGAQRRDAGTRGHDRPHRPDAFRARGLAEDPGRAWSPSPARWSTPAWWRSTGARR